MTTKEKKAAYAKTYYALNKERIAAQQKEYKAKNPNKIKDIINKWNELNHEKRLAHGRKWNKLNYEKKRFYWSKRHAAKMQRTPKWANMKAIKEFYKKCPKGMQVDHIIPLQGESVSGLHVEYNLQYLTPAENSRKKNHFNS